MTIQNQLKPLLQQFNNSVGKGNLIVANNTLVKVIELMAIAIDQPCACNCSPKPFTLPPKMVAETVLPITPTAPIVPTAPTPPEKRGRGRPKKER